MEVPAPQQRNMSSPPSLTLRTLASSPPQNPRSRLRRSPLAGGQSGVTDDRGEWRGVCLTGAADGLPALSR
ncbi:hypothetical protein CEP53_013684 [Fusarium sp. AF-6]|nr:hypothetical protein CEP53_013684 [Fusarium sp. AF-6]